MTRLTFGILYSQNCQIHLHSRFKSLQNIFLRQIVQHQKTSFYWVQCLEVGFFEKFWKIVFVRQRQVQMSFSKILGTENSIYNFQMQFEKPDICVHPLENRPTNYRLGPSVFQNSHFLSQFHRIIGDSLQVVQILSKIRNFRPWCVLFTSVCVWITLHQQNMKWRIWWSNRTKPILYRTWWNSKANVVDNIALNVRLNFNHRSF